MTCSDFSLCYFYRSLPGFTRFLADFFGRRSYSLILYGVAAFLLHTKVLALLAMIRITNYWITTFFCCVFTPPLEFWAVTVITLSPIDKGGVK